jgi:hypothetical protein
MPTGIIKIGFALFFGFISLAIISNLDFGIIDSTQYAFAQISNASSQQKQQQQQQQASSSYPPPISRPICSTIPITAPIPTSWTPTYATTIPTAAGFICQHNMRTYTIPNRVRRHTSANRGPLFCCGHAKPIRHSI